MAFEVSKQTIRGDIRLAFYIGRYCRSIIEASYGDHGSAGSSVLSFRYNCFSRPIFSNVSGYVCNQPKIQTRRYEIGIVMFRIVQLLDIRYWGLRAYRGRLCSQKLLLTRRHLTNRCTGRRSAPGASELKR